MHIFFIGNGLIINVFYLYILYCKKKNGAWRSSVARPAGGREVVGSNPAAPTIQKGEKNEKDINITTHHFYSLIRM